MPAIPPVPYAELPAKGLDAQRVEALWFYRTNDRGVQRVLPDGRTDVVVHVRTTDGEHLTTVPRLAIAGPTDRPREVPVSGDSASVGLRLRPAWAATCLATDAPALRDRVLVGTDALDLLGPLAEPVLAARSVTAVIDALRGLATEMALRQPTRDGQQRAHRAVQLLEDGPNRQPADVARTLNVAERTLRRDVLAAVGLPMRSLVGLARFRRALALMREGRSSLSDIALSSGYSDQAHMNREFRRFGGFTPGTPAAVPLIGTGPRGA